MPRPAAPVPQSTRRVPTRAEAAGAPAELASPPEPEVDALSELPDVLMQILLRALASGGAASPKAAEAAALALVRLAACSSHLRRAVAALDDDAWLVRAARTTRCRPWGRVRAALLA